MKITLAAHHLKRYKEICLLLWKYGRSDLVKQMGAHDDFGEGFEPSEIEEKSSGAIEGEELANDLEAMGPTYVKIGQILASRPDLLPEPYLKALARLQDNVKPFPSDQVEEIVTSELGVRISKAFASFNFEPIAAASLGQAHAAVLRDGRPVVVKVQRPNITEQISEDFEILAEIAEFFDAHTELGEHYHFLEMLEELRITIQRELNYELEAQNLIVVGKNLASFENIIVPQPIEDYSTRRILTMQYVYGKKITSLGPLARLEMNGGVLAEELFHAYLKQVLVDGIFHADPHPGNVFVTGDNRIALIDLGMVGHTSATMQEHLLKMLLAVSEGKTEAAAEVAISISETTEEFDSKEFVRKISQMLVGAEEQSLSEMNIGKMLLQISRIAANQGLFVPSELTLLGKTLLQLDEVGKILDPTFNTNASIRRNASEILSERMHKDTSQESLFSRMLEVKEFVVGLPVRLNKILDAASNADLEFKIRALDAKPVMEAMQKIANRITMGLVLASLIIGASLLMRIDTPFRILGYPGLAILLFLVAAAGGFSLVISIYSQDKKSEKRKIR